MTGNDGSVVFALDIGVYRTGANGQILSGTTAAWSRLTRGVADFDCIKHSGTPTYGQFTDSSDLGESSTSLCGRSMEKLAELMADDLRGGRRVALGFEAPMWLPLEERHRANLNLFAPRFTAERGSEWYLQSGAAATLKAISLGVMLRNRLRELVGTAKRTTLVKYWQPGTIFLFEAFVVGKYKVNNVTPGFAAPDDERDAFTAALAWGNLHMGFVTPTSFQGVCLHAAGARSDPCLSLWDVIFGAGSFSAPGQLDCEVVALERQEE
ncbi:MAG: hypothetical protein ABSB94_21115 [Syntrophorhabdales bacterium]|jgi:hypothetical protein